MQILPTPPTDNIYKFMAIFGLWLSIGLLIFFIWIGYFQFQLEIDSKKIQSYYHSVNMKEDIEARLKAINENSLKKNKLSWVPTSFDQEQEIKFLNEALKNHNQTLDKHKDLVNLDNSMDLKVLEAVGFYWIIPIYVCTAIGLMWGGFRLWYIRIQVPSEEMDRLNLRLKKLELRKMKKVVLTRRSS